MPIPTAAQLANAHITIMGALHHLAGIGAPFASIAHPAHRLFELAVLVEMLQSPSPLMRWRCSHGTTLRFHPMPQTLPNCPVFTPIGPPQSWAIAVNVEVHFGNGPSDCEYHEADLAYFSYSAVANAELHESDVGFLVESKFLQSIPKQVLRGLAFFAQRMRPLSVALATAHPPIKRPPPPYWAQAANSYGVREFRVRFP